MEENQVEILPDTDAEVLEDNSSERTESNIPIATTTSPGIASFSPEDFIVTIDGKVQSLAKSGIVCTLIEEPLCEDHCYKIDTLIDRAVTVGSVGLVVKGNKVGDLVRLLALDTESNYWIGNIIGNIRGIQGEQGDDGLEYVQVKDLTDDYYGFVTNSYTEIISVPYIFNRMPKQYDSFIQLRSIRFKSNTISKIIFDIAMCRVNSVNEDTNEVTYTATNHSQLTPVIEIGEVVNVDNDVTGKPGKATATIDEYVDSKSINISKLNLGIPVGEKGDQGIEGPIGPPGPRGESAIANIVNKGDYDPEGLYIENDLVYFTSEHAKQAGVYACLSKTLIQGTTPNTHPQYWGIFTVQGAPGPEGPRGPVGPEGPAGKDADTSKFVTNDLFELANMELEEKIYAKYTKPSSGIPKSDLASPVQTSLNNADKAAKAVMTVFLPITKTSTATSPEGILRLSYVVKSIPGSSNEYWFTDLTTFQQALPEFYSYLKSKVPVGVSTTLSDLVNLIKIFNITTSTRKIDYQAHDSAVGSSPGTIIRTGSVYIPKGEGNYIEVRLEEL